MDFIMNISCQPYKPCTRANTYGDNGKESTYPQQRLIRNAGFSSGIENINIKYTPV